MHQIKCKERQVYLKIENDTCISRNDFPTCERVKRLEVREIVLSLQHRSRVIGCVARIERAQEAEHGSR